MIFAEVSEQEIKEYVTNLFQGQYHMNESSIENKLSSLLFGIEKLNYNDIYDDLKKQGPRKVCQYQFRKNDIVWICRSCQTDETCVLCNDCFQNSNHDGHEVYFYHSQAGGCCDCGDAGAWKPEGFCTKHGRTIPNPMINIPSVIQQNGDILMTNIILNIISYCQNVVQNYQFTNIVNNQYYETVYYLLIQKSDVITSTELEHSLLKIGLSHQKVQDTIKKIQEEGFQLIGPKDLAECLRDAQTIIDEEIFVGIVDNEHKFRTSAFLIVINWLFKIAQTTDGMCRLITKTLTVDRIYQIMKTDPYLTKNVIVSLHGLMLTLMADQQFKIDSSRAYALAFSEVSQIHSAGLGTSQNSLFGLSVQFLNRYFYVEPLLIELNFFPSLSKSLKKIILSNFQNFQKSKALLHRRYYHVIADLKVIMNLPQTSRFFSELCFHDILEIFYQYQYFHPQIRLIGDHIEIEPTDWMISFNLFIGISNLFDYFVNWFGSLESIQPIISPISSHPLPTTYDHIHLIFNELLRWQNSFFEQSVWNSYRIPYLENKTFQICNEFTQKSFHLYLHRYIASCIKEASRFPHLIETISQIQSDLFHEKTIDKITLYKLLDVPLNTLLFESQIRAGMWRRNGMNLYDQVHNYGEPNFCRQFRDLDIIFLQFIGTLFDGDIFLNYIIYRFSLNDLLFTKSSPSSFTEYSINQELLASFLHLIINLITELPLPPYEDQTERSKLMLRREFIHYLVSGPSAYSDLQTLMQLVVPENDKSDTKILDDLVNLIGEWQQSSSHEPSKVKLKEKFWSDYDPTFPHLAHSTHQRAFELRPKIKISQPYISNLPPSHPLFINFRTNILMSQTLWNVLRDIIYSYLIARDRSISSYISKQHSRIQCNINTLTLAIHLLTLVIHHLFSSEIIYQSNPNNPDDVKLSSSEKKIVFSKFLIQKISNDSISIDDSDFLNFDDKPPSTSFLDIIIQLYQFLSQTSGGDDSMKHWIFWILTKITDLSSECEDIVGNKLRAEMDEKRKQELLERKNKARERAMQAMKKNAAAFESHIENNEENNLDDVNDLTQDEQESSMKECIVCRSNENTDTLCYIGYSQASQYLNHHGIPQLHMKDNKSTLPTLEEPNLHIQFCGHCIHVLCFDRFIASFLSRPLNQNDLIISSDRGQFQCPLCNKIGNFILPIYHHEKNQKSNILKDDVNWIDWIHTDTERGLKRELSRDEDNDIDNPNLKSSTQNHDNNQKDDDNNNNNNNNNNQENVDDIDIDIDTDLDHFERDVIEDLSITSRISGFLRRIGPFSLFSSSNNFDNPSSPPRRNRSNSSSNQVATSPTSSISTSLLTQSQQDFREKQLKIHQNCFRLMGELCEPLYGKAFYNSTDSYKMIPKYLETLLSSLSFTVNIDCLENDFLGTKSNGLDIYEHLNIYASTIGYCLEMWGIRQSLLYRLLVTLKGQQDSMVASWTRSIIIPSISSSSNNNDLDDIDINSINPLWFDKPILSMNLLDTLTLFIITSKYNTLTSLPSSQSQLQSQSQSLESSLLPQEDNTLVQNNQLSLTISQTSLGRQNDTSTVKWIFIAYLIQLFVIECNQLENEKISNLDDEINDELNSENLLSGWNIGSLFYEIFDFIMKEKEKVYFHNTNWQNRFHLSNNKIELIFKNILLKWLIYLRVAGRIIQRCDSELYSLLQFVTVSKIESIDDLTKENVLNFIESFQMKELINLTNENKISFFNVISIWLQKVYKNTSNSNNNNNNNNNQQDFNFNNLLGLKKLSYPTQTIRQFLELPNSYTNLHAQITSKCNYEYPAICYICGEILDAGGKGKCTQHIETCGGEVGIFFLLQDCQFLILFTQRGVYYTSPYVDSRGERHKSFRGKPLFLDQKRLILMIRLYLSHGIPKEVTQKRSMSQRVIINGHY